jgi:nucleotide-binding universal stress UspA family protein
MSGDRDDRLGVRAQLRVPAVVAEGAPIVALVAAAETAALLVFGTPGRSLFAGLLLGSVSRARVVTGRREGAVLEP